MLFNIIRFFINNTSSFEKFVIIEPKRFNQIYYINSIYIKLTEFLKYHTVIINKY